MMLTVLEHQKVYIGKFRDETKPQISYEDANLLRMVDLNNRGIFKWGNHFLIPQQWVGAIALPGLSIEILPKVTDYYDENFTKRVLLQMFKVANNIPTKKNVSAKVSFAKNGLIEILIANFLDCIEHYIKEGFISSYCKVTRNLPAIKGSIDFSKQINKNLLNPTRFVCRYSRMEVDNPVNGLLKYVLNVMQKVSCDYSNCKRIVTALVYFDVVKEMDEKSVRNNNIQITKVNQRVQILLQYAYLFLDGYAVSINNGKNTVSSMLFDMNKVFEKFIYKSYRKVFGGKVQYQSAKNYLITDKNSAAKRINLRPDLLIYSPGGVKMVVDTKWKRIRKFVKESDVYQMNAYVSAIDKVDTAILLYPKAEDASGAVGDYEFTNSSGNKELKIRTVDLSLIADEKNFSEHIKSLLT
ncbi:McrC family protein [Lacrimispora sp. JR3]|uniref:McrC family protein n=1 Tax=Lacrimispora sinapis TaxID=3111456 RepID=UPI0037487FBE